MRQAKQPKFFKTLIAALLFTAAAAQAQDVKFLWSDTHNQVLARHNAALYTPVQTPPNWVNERFSISQAQQSINKLYPVDRKVVHSIRVDRPLEQAQLETMTIDGKRVPINEDW